MNERQVRLQELYKQHGKLTPDIVIADAKQDSSPLHSVFEWNIQTAAYEHWKQTARDLIRSVKVYIVETDRYYPVYIENPSKAHNEQGYIATADLRDHKDEARKAVVNELKLAHAALARARAVADALDIGEEIDIFIDRLIQLQSHARVGFSSDNKDSISQ